MPEAHHIRHLAGAGEILTDSSDQRIEDLSREAARATAELEARLAALSIEAERVKQDLDASRGKAQREREELDIEYSLEIGASYVVEAPGSENLRRAERELTERTIRAAGLQRRLAEFTSLLASTGRQFDTERALPGIDAATEATIRSASVEAQERERQRLAREVHDGPAQALANAIIALEFVERAIRSGGEDTAGRALEEVERIKSTLREGLTEIRRFIFDLRPTMLQDRGLAATIEHYVATYQSLFPMAIDLHTNDSIPRLTNDQELTAFRVVQEGIQNARKHARATRVKVDIEHSAGSLTVMIEDNGRGFSPDRVTTHVMGGAGLRGMRERAALVGGDIEIRSAPGEGATIVLSIPLVAAMLEGDNSATGHQSEPADTPLRSRAAKQRMLNSQSRQQGLD